jgi:hypothetical protein
MAGPHEPTPPTRWAGVTRGRIAQYWFSQKLSESRRRGPGRRDPQKCPDLSPDSSPGSSPDLSPDPMVGCGAQCVPRDDGWGDESLAAAAGGVGLDVSCGDSRMGASW